jgi:hypothetical protein
MRRTPGLAGPQLSIEELNGASDAPKYSADTQFRVCFKDLPRRSLAYLLGSMYDGTLRSSSEKGAERVSGRCVGTLNEIAAKYDLQVS